MIQSFKYCPFRICKELKFNKFCRAQLVRSIIYKYRWVPIRIPTYTYKYTHDECPARTKFSQQRPVRICRADTYIIYVYSYLDFVCPILRMLTRKLCRSRLSCQRVTFYIHTGGNYHKILDRKKKSSREFETFSRKGSPLFPSLPPYPLPSP